MPVDLKKYKKWVEYMGSLSELFSDDKTIYLSPKFVERLFVYASDSNDISGKDISFDAITKQGGGVGVKTFRTKSPSAPSLEKVAEFTSLATRGEFVGLNDMDLVKKVATFRNDRVITDARIYNIDLDVSYYHCLVRTPQGCFIHEEPYPLIDIQRIKLLKKRKNPVFTDGSSRYSFSAAKSVLYKEFSPRKSVPLIRAKPRSNIFESLDNMWLADLPKATVTHNKRFDYVILPLYGSNLEVNQKSGINQWNAAGRRRRFGEGYIPFPAEVRRIYPDFFPGIEEQFTVRLTNGEEIICKVCQEDGKAIMSTPNHKLLEWLFRMIDVEDSISEARFVDKRPYTMEDLQRVGKDSVKFTVLDRINRIYSLEPMASGSYEEFIGLKFLNTK